MKKQFFIKEKHFKRCHFLLEAKPPPPTNSTSLKRCATQEAPCPVWIFDLSQKFQHLPRQAGGDLKRAMKDAAFPRVKQTPYGSDLSGGKIPMLKTPPSYASRAKYLDSMTPSPVGMQSVLWLRFVFHVS